MTSLICKVCGGKVSLIDDTHGICEYCDTKVTLPKIDDDKRVGMYNRGTHFRQSGDFDRAYSAYENIIAEDPTDAEAHWSLALCRYGIEYVKDPATGRHIPTCSRLDTTSILADIDYQAALEYAPNEEARDGYRAAAREIAAIQERFLAISQNEAPYDVFICFKAEEDWGERTRGSVVAQDIYGLLEKEGLRTFFSRITLEDKLGSEYEPYIYAALNSAKVMLVVTNDAAHLKARWVENEWKRYMAIMSRDPSKVLIPVCVDMAPGELPAEFGRFQAQDWSKIGAAQDLVRGVKKICGKLPTQTTVIQQAAHSVNVDNLLVAVQRAIEDEDYKQALKVTNQVLAEDPDNGKAHYYFLLASNEVSVLEALDEETDWSNDSKFKRAMQYATPETKELLEGFFVNRKNEKIYRSACFAAEENQQSRAAKLFASIPGYKDADERQARAIAVYEKQKIHAAATSQFDKEVGNKHDYLYRELLKRHPDLARRYNSLRITADKDDWTEGVGVHIMSLAILILCIIMPFDPTSGFSPIAAAVLASIVFHTRLDIDFGLIKSIAITFGFLVVLGLATVFLESIPVLQFLVIIALGSVFYLIDLFQRIRAGKVKSATKALQKLRMNEIEPKLGEIRRDLLSKYTEISDEGYAKHLVGQLKF